VRLTRLPLCLALVVVNYALTVLREWDEAVLRAVDRTRELPKDIDGRAPHKVVIVFRPND